MTFPSPRYSKLIIARDGLGFQRNQPEKNNRKLAYEHGGRIIAPVLLTETVQRS